jgi:hypothetical protein
MSINPDELTKIKLKKTETRVTGLDGSVRVENAQDSTASSEIDNSEAKGFFILGSANAAEQDENDSKAVAGVVEFDAGVGDQADDSSELERKAKWFLQRKKIGNGFKCASKENLPKVGVYVIEEPKKSWEPHFDHLAFLLCDEFEVCQVNDKDIREGKLDDLSAIIFPGGKIWEVDSSLSDQGSERLANFIANGGGYVGMCAGGFLATADGFGGCNSKRALVDCSTSWTAGLGSADVEVTAEGAQLLGFQEGEEKNLFFANGPHFKLASRHMLRKQQHFKIGHTKLPLNDILPLLKYKQVKGSNGTTRKEFDGFDIASFSSSLEKGRIVAFGPHPKSSDPKIWLQPFKRCIKYVCYLE